MTLQEGLVRLLGIPYRYGVLDSPAPGKGQDAWLIQDGFIGVADGSTPLVGGDQQVHQFAVDALTHLAASGDAEASEAFRSALVAVSTAAELHEVERHPSCTVGTLREFDGRLEAAVLGDCTVVATSTEAEAIVLEDNRLSRFDEPAAAALSQALSTGASEREAWEAIAPTLLANRQRANRDDTYWVFSGDTRAAKHIRTARIMGTPDTVLIYSDGFSRLITPFALAADPLALASWARSEGLGILASALRNAEHAAGSLERHPRLGRFDDVTAILLVRDSGDRETHTGSDGL